MSGESFSGRNEHWVDSVGIDIGTSTTKWVWSRLRLSRGNVSSSLPRYSVVGHELLYASPLRYTPLVGNSTQDESEIDFYTVADWLREEYKRAGLDASAIQTGAVIVTGESAAKRNAEALVRQLSARAGSFVAAAAGADLESLLAGKGSGAWARSLERSGVVCNVDIGGGTANAAYYREGAMISTVTLHIGGRMIRLDKDGRIRYVSAAIRDLTSLSAGQIASFDEIRATASFFAATLLAVVMGENVAGAGSIVPALLAGGCAEALPHPDELWISGGVGALMQEKPPADLAETARYGDIGPLLAAELTRHAAQISIPVRPAEHAERATVIGTGTFTTELSGATLYLDPVALPLRNIPAVPLVVPFEHIVDTTEPDDDRIGKAVDASLARAVSLWGARYAEGLPPFAVALHTSEYLSYLRTTRLASALLEGYRKAAPLAEALLIVCDRDMGKSLGLALRKAAPPNLQIVCLDELRLEDGQFIDVGEPLKYDLIPVVIKTLVFGQQGHAHQKQEGTAI